MPAVSIRISNNIVPVDTHSFLVRYTHGETRLCSIELIVGGNPRAFSASASAQALLHRDLLGPNNGQRTISKWQQSGDVGKTLVVRLTPDGEAAVEATATIVSLGT